MSKDLRFAFFAEGTDYTSFATDKEGVKYYRKQILRFGTWRHPNKREITFEITPEVVQQVANNFTVGVPVEAPIVLTHTDDPKMKVGGVKYFIPTDVGLDAVFSVVDQGMIKKIDDKETAPGVSCWLDLNYKDKQTDKSVGAVVKHVALVNHPYIEGLGGYEAVTLSEDKAGAEMFVPMTMSEKETNLSNGDENMTTLNELIKVLKEEHKVDLVQLQEDLKILNDQIEKGELVKKADAPVLSEELIKDIKTRLKLGEDVSVEDAVKALSTSMNESIKLSEQEANEKNKTQKELDEVKLMLTEMKGEKEIDAMIAEGKVLPVEKEALLSAYKTNKEIFDSLMKTRTVSLVELAEQGLKSDETPLAEKEKDQKLIDEQVRLAEEEGIAPSSK